MRLSLLQKRHLRPLVGIVTALLILEGAVRTVIRNRDWSDNRRLWEATYAAAPGARRGLISIWRPSISKVRIPVCSGRVWR